jgi:two-component system sensor kinase
MGDLREAKKEAMRMHQSGLDLGDLQASGLSVDILSKSSCGEISQEIVRAELDRPRGMDAQTASQVLQAEGVRLMFLGRFLEAAEVFKQGYRVASKAGITNTYVIPCLPWAATAFRRAAEISAADDPRETARLSRQARHYARLALRRSRKLQNDLPHALRENAILAFHAGRVSRARSLFGQSLDVAQQQGARYEHAQTLLALGQMDAELGRQGGEEQVSEATEVIDAIVSDEFRCSPTESH